MKKLNLKSTNTSFFLIISSLTVVLMIGCFAPLGIYPKHIIIQTMFYAYMATAWNLMCGYTGRLSLGHSAYIAVAAYTSLILYKSFALTPWIGMLLGGLLAMGLMFIIAFPCFRFGLKGPYFTLSSIAIMEIVRYLLTSMRSITSGSLGMSLPYHKSSFLLFQFDAKEPYFIIIVIFWLAAVLLLWKMERTRYYLEAIREDDDAAAALGISINKNLIRAALLSAFLVAIGGTFYVQYYRYIDPHTICGFPMALNLALIAIIGGSGTILGPTIGAALVIPISEVLRTILGDKLSGLHLFIYGVLLIIMIIYMPRGVISIPGILKKRAASKARVKALAMEAGGKIHE
ncbi:MAG TPA: branched-chain amino acid ABC transporter permease [Anaerovoracaceae bacterium]|nr:branched-chain amino acid ABC transporter permease [Anaerovoracaceae bacterium]